MGSNTERWVPEQAGLEPFVSLLIIIGVSLLAAVAVVRRYRSLL